jgi:hypothetical protein
MRFIISILSRLISGASLASVLLIGGCGSDTRSWQEEVKLADGRVITVTQRRRYENVYDGQRSGNLSREFWLTFKLTEFDNQEITWHENLVPRVLNVYQGKLYVVGIPSTEREFRQYGNPNPSYLGYRHEAGQWQRIRFNEIPEAIYDTNLLIASELPGDVKFVSLARKADEIANDRLRNAQKRIDPKYVALHY